MKFTEEELNEIKKMQEDYARLTAELGQLEVEKISLEQRKNVVLSNYMSIQQKENELAKKLQEKYGDGELNLETGEFINKSS